MTATTEAPSALVHAVAKRLSDLYDRETRKVCRNNGLADGSGFDGRPAFMAMADCIGHWTHTVSADALEDLISGFGGSIRDAWAAHRAACPHPEHHQ